MRDVEDVKDDHPSRGSPMGPRIGPPGRRGGRRPPRRPKVAKTSHFPLFWRLAGHLSPFSEISDKVNIRGKIVCFPRKIQWLGPESLQTAATATLWARDGPESSSGSSILHYSPTLCSKVNTDYQTVPVASCSTMNCKREQSFVRMRNMFKANPA